MVAKIVLLGLFVVGSVSYGFCGATCGGGVDAEERTIGLDQFDALEQLAQQTEDSLTKINGNLKEKYATFQLRLTEFKQKLGAARPNVREYKLAAEFSYRQREIIRRLEEVIPQTQSNVSRVVPANDQLSLEFQKQYQDVVGLADTEGEHHEKSLDEKWEECGKNPDDFEQKHVTPLRDPLIEELGQLVTTIEMLEAGNVMRSLKRLARAKKLFKMKRIVTIYQNKVREKGF